MRLQYWYELSMMLLKQVKHERISNELKTKEWFLNENLDKSILK